MFSPAFSNVPMCGSRDTSSENFTNQHSPSRRGNARVDGVRLFYTFFFFIFGRLISSLTFDVTF
jgi:hypothetical protein